MNDSTIRSLVSRNTASFSSFVPLASAGSGKAKCNWCFTAPTKTGQVSRAWSQTVITKSHSSCVNSLTSCGCKSRIGIPASFITSIARGCVLRAGCVPADLTQSLASKCCRQACAILLRQLLPVQSINIFFILFAKLRIIFEQESIIPWFNKCLCLLAIHMA